jgi:xylan 1,4-beta-xylosidase
LHPGTEKIEGVDGIATKSGRELDMLLWNYKEDDATAEVRFATLKVKGIPEAAKNAKIETFRVDEENSNAFTVWKRMGSPQTPSKKQYAELEKAGHLNNLGKTLWTQSEAGNLEFPLILPKQSLLLIRITW